MYRTILFDFDGTLVPSLELWLKAFQHAVAMYGREIPEETIIQRFYYRDYVEVCEEFGFPSATDMERYVHDGLAAALEGIAMFEGAEPLIAAARAAGKQTGLVTSSPRKPVEATLRRLGVLEMFDTIVTGDDITHYKPHPEPVLLALTRLGANAGDTLFVGDYQYDVLAGKAAGTSTALFLPEGHRRFYDFDKLRSTEPDIVFHDYRTLAKLLQ